MKPRNDYLERFKRSQEAKKPARKSKRIAAMSETELQAEGKRVRAALRRSQEEEVRAGREELARRSTSLADLLRSRSRRRPAWK